ncbi:MAG: DUF3293 domain-containing protein [Zavarzinella sp.]|nr:DUF3293 domain-containing protein [Zavarzinella sp.]
MSVAPSYWGKAPGVNPMSSSRDELEAAYWATDYRVDDAPGGPFVIRIGECCDRLAGAEWAFVTACNPRSVCLSDEENARRTAELDAAVGERGWTVYRGHGVGRDGTWPPEPSLLIVGIAEADALGLAKRFGQNAIVAGRAGGPARLVWVG